MTFPAPPPVCMSCALTAAVARPAAAEVTTADAHGPLHSFLLCSACQGDDAVLFSLAGPGEYVLSIQELP